MELIRTKLRTLLELVALREKQLTNGIKQNNRNRVEVLGSSNSFRNFINEIIQYIAYTITQSKDRSQDKTLASLRHFCSSQDLLTLCKIKQSLEDIRHQFSKLNTEGKIRFGQIKAEIKNLIGICTHSGNNQHFQYTSRDRAYSTNPEYPHILAYSPNINSFSNQIRETESERTARIKAELYKQMNNHLQFRRNTSKDQIQTHKILKKDYGSEKIPPKMQTEKKFIQTKRNITIPNSKRRFNYLSEYQKQINSDKHYEQKTQYEMTPKKISKQISPPSTQNTSPKIFSADFDPLGWELQRIAPIKHPQLEKLRETANLAFDQYFQQDSVEKDMNNRQNLDDSLEIMKQQQQLNNTGCFGFKILEEYEHHQYSFSNN